MQLQNLFLDSCYLTKPSVLLVYFWQITKLLSCNLFCWLLVVFSQPMWVRWKKGSVALNCQGPQMTSVVIKSLAAWVVTYVGRPTLEGGHFFEMVQLRQPLRGFCVNFKVTYIDGGTYDTDGFARARKYAHIYQSEEHIHANTKIHISQYPYVYVHACTKTYTHVHRHKQMCPH